MLRRLMGALLGTAMVFTTALIVRAEPVSADGCGQECGTQYEQCIITGGSPAFCEDEGQLNGWCRDWGSTTCLW